MSTSLVLSGFESFLDVERNPSGEVAERLAAEPPAELAIASGVLPVSFARVPAAFDAIVARLGDARPAVLLGLGVHRGPSFRLESRARGRLTSEQRDNDGVVGDGLVLLDGATLSTSLALEPLGEALTAAGAEEVILSDDAGGYVCERTYHHILDRARSLGVPGLFLHVPPVEFVPVERQVQVVRAFAAHLARTAASAG